MENKKPQKFLYEEIALKNDFNSPYSQNISPLNAKRLCLCGNYNEFKTFQCFKCRQKVHICAKIQNNRPQFNKFQCLSCLARNMDLVYQPQNILLETFYKTQNVFERTNLINFQFYLRFQDTKMPVDVRGFKGNKIQLAWPMQGQFYLNGAKQPIYSLKPLKANSNRANRKQDTFLIDSKRLKEGKNILTFKIPRLDKNKTKQKYQYEQTGVYFLGIYSVKQLNDQQVMNITKKQRRFEKAQTLQLFRMGDEQLPTQIQKVKLIDPYTGERIKFPVRGRYCNHISPVCLVSYLGFQKHSRSWRCPICSVKSNSFMNQPYLDLWLYEILKDNTRGESVFLYLNGTYEWQPMQQKPQSLDSDDESDQNRVNLMRQIIEQEPIITELQNFDLESHHQQNHGQQINLIDYDQIQQVQRPYDHFNYQQSQLQRVYEDGQMSNLYNQQSQQHFSNYQPQLNQQQAIVEQLHDQSHKSHRSDSNSEFQFPFNNNDYVPSKRLQGIKIQQPSQVPQKKQFQAPQIYTKPLQKKPKIQTNQSSTSNIQATPMKLQLQLMQQKLRQKTKQNKTTQNKIPKQQNLSNITPTKPSVGQNQFTHGNKRMIERPNFIQTNQQRLKQDKIRSLQMQRPQNFSFGKIQKKNIQLSQNKSLKSQSKLQYSLGNIFPLPPKKTNQFPPPPAPSTSKSHQKQKVRVEKRKKQEELSEKPKSQKIKIIKSIKCTPISHSKFVKQYCRIPIPFIVRRMNDDFKRIFANIL